jgi:type II secretory pathway component GspD/PulD (secretin)
MKTNSTSSLIGGCRAVAMIILAMLSLVPFAHSQPDRAKGTVIPLIVMNDVPLLDAIQNLARQAGINYIIDPRVLTNYSQTVSVRLENKSAEQALNMVLTNHDLSMINNPATTVTRIAHQKQNVKPVDPSQVGNDTSRAIPLIVMDEVPLADAIQNLARQARLDVTVDPKVSQPPVNARGPMARPPTLSIRWENLTPKQALTAIVDNYELAMTQDGATARIAPKNGDAK